MRRSSVSVAANIAEGHQRRGKHEFLNFLNIAHGSLDELQYYLLLTRDLRYVPEENLRRPAQLADDVGKMLNGLRLHIRKEVRNA
jgi:four helix bundle protein